MGNKQGKGKNQKDDKQNETPNQNNSPVDDDKDEREEKNAKLNQVKVHVIQAKGLPAKDKTGSSDPYCVVRIGDHQYRTCVRSRDVNPVWNETFIENGQNLLKNLKEIVFTVYDKDKLARDDLIGEYKLVFNQQITSAQTAPQWYPLVDQNNKEAGKIQFQLQFIEDVNELSVRDFTHILQFTIKEGKNLRNMEWIGKNDPYVRIEWGSQVWKTKTVKGTDNPKWNDTLYVFVDETHHSHYVLACSILDVDFAKDQHIGHGYIHAKDIFEKGTYDKPVVLTKKLVNLDKKLQTLDKEAKSEENCGELYVEAILHKRKDIEKEFYTSLLKSFDVNHDGYLNKEEVKSMLACLKADVSSDEFFTKFDKNADEKLDHDEVIAMLSDSQFQDSDLAPQLILQHLRKDSASFSSMLMTGFSHAEETNHRKVITLKDRKTGLLVQENIPSYIWISMRLLYDNKTGRVITHNVKSMLKKMSKEKGDEYDKQQSIKEINPFIALHGLDVNILMKDVSEFETFNDFFARAIRLDCRPMTNNESDIASPADCRMMLFSSIYDASIWVKGDKFTVSELLGPTRAQISSKFEGGAFCIARLAPQDYHRFHWPVSGKITEITPIDGALYTVNPVAVNKPLNVYSENKRCVIEIKSKVFGDVIMIAVAATMVGSYLLFKEGTIKLEVGMEVGRGDVAGEFRFGGSTVLLLFEPNKLKWNDDILYNSNKSVMETLVQCRETIGNKA